MVTIISKDFEIVRARNPGQDSIISRSVWFCKPRKGFVVRGSLLSNLFVCEKTKNEEAGGIGIICVGGLLTSDMRRGRAETTPILLLPLSSKSVWFFFHSFSNVYCFQVYKL